MKKITIEDVHTIINTYLGNNKHKFYVLKHDTSAIGEDVVGYLGEHSRLRIVLLTGKNVKTEFFFVKTLLPESNLHHEFMLKGNVHVKEAYVYEKLLPLIQNIRIEKQHWSPKSFLTRPELIVLEDLSVSGYRCADRLKCLDYQHVVLVLKSLAELHSASLIFEEKKRKETGRDWQFIDEYPTAFTESLFKKDPEFLGYRWAEAAAKANLALLELVAPKSCDLEKIKKSFSEIANAMYDAVKPSSKFRNTICHGDLWANNILFQYKNDIPVDCCLVDYQLVRYAPPAQDILWFLHLTTSTRFRKDHLDGLLKLYYEELNSLVADSNLDITVILPFSELLESCQSLFGFAKCATAMYLQLVYMQDSLTSELMESKLNTLNALYLKRSEAVLQSFEKDSNYRTRLSEVIIDLVEEVL